MVKHSLFRHAILFFLSLTFLGFHSGALAAEDQTEKDLQQEELNINADQGSSADAMTANKAIPIESGAALDSNKKSETEFPTELNSADTVTKPSDDFSDQQLSANTSGLVLDERENSDLPPGEVAVERGEDYNLPYKKRRSHHGVLFSVGMEKLDPTEYISLLDDTPIKDMLGDSVVTLLGAELGYKYNFSLGSVYILGGFSAGKLSSDSTGTTRELDLQKLSLSAGYSADAMFDEPWIVPYGQVGIHQFSVSETKADTSDSATTQISLNYRFGLLFQLNWIEKSIDPSTHEEGLRSSGLENTFLDVYASWYEPSSDLFDPANAAGTASGDPDLRSEATLGVALKMEF